MIEVENLARIFRTYKKQPGFWGGIKGLFRREFEEAAAFLEQGADVRLDHRRLDLQGVEGVLLAQPPAP
mgnify:CR=1 FL=1